MPTPFCSEVNGAYARLAGLKIGPGFKKRVAGVVGGVSGCTHLTELLGPIATTAFQTVGQAVMAEKTQGDEITPRQWVIDGCHAYRAGGEIARGLIAAEAGRPLAPAKPAADTDEAESRG
ncbi:hypothetical protein D3C79_903300 [compost metagenome]